MALRRQKKGQRVRILFVDSMNDLPSQLAEYWARKFYPDAYEVYSAGPKHDIVDCDLLSVMYSIGEDLRDQTSKDFSSGKLPEDNVFDYVIYTQKGVFDQLARNSPWRGRQILAHFGTRKEFRCIDDAELADCLIDMSDRISNWVRDNMDDPKKLEALISA